MYQTVANKLTHGLYMVQESKFIWGNESFAQIFGYTQDEINSINFMDLIYPEDTDKFLHKDIHSNTFENYEVEGRCIKKDGSVITISVSNRRIVFEGKPTSIGSVIDISDRKMIELALKESQERYRNIVEYSPVGIMVHQNGIIEYANPFALKLLRAKAKEEVIGKHMLNFVHYDFKPLVSKRIDKVVSNGVSVPPLYQKMIQVDGSEIDVEVSGIPIQLGNIPAVEIMFWDVTEKKKEEDLIRYRAYFDTLTDLPNFHKFQLDFEEEFNKDRTFTIMYLDLEGLKEVNNIYGRQAGDMVLIKVAARLSGAMGHEGLIYRMNGDIFLIALPGIVQEKELRAFTERISKIVSQPIYTSNSTVQLSLNIGVVSYPHDGVEIEMLLRHADMAMNYSKKSKTLFRKYDY